MVSERRLLLLEFACPDDGYSALVAVDHVGMREFRRALLARLEPAQAALAAPLYQYGIFRDDESLIFNARPDDAGARPITVAYIGAEGPEQP